MQVTRRAALLGLAAAAGGCAPRARVALLPEAAAVGTLREVFVATTRAPDAAGEPGAGRSLDPAFARYDVSIPPRHVRGEMAFPGREPPDPVRHFVAAGVERFAGEEEFRAALGRALRAPGAGREAVIYVHGFNNTFAEGLFRIAQIAHDLKAPAVTVHYSWPSAANPLRYAYDRDSVLFARDGLVGLIRAVKAAGAARIYLVAHSMGALLTMEALRQLDIARPGAAAALVSGVVLFSPDIDVELFRAQTAAIRTLPDPFVIFTSRRDRALGLSARLTGRDGERLGSLRDFQTVADLDVVLFDVSAFQTGGFNHFALARSPTLLRLFGGVREIDAALAADQAGRTGLFPGTVLTLQNATAIILSPVTGGLP